MHTIIICGQFFRPSEYPQVTANQSMCWRLMRSSAEHRSYTGINIYIPAGRVKLKVPEAPQFEGRSGWSAHQKHADGTEAGKAKVT